MITIRFNGGIGNQVFQYAFYKYLEKHNIVLQADISTYTRQQIHGGFLLNRLFPKNTINVSHDNFDQFYRTYNVTQRIENKLTHHVGIHYYEEYFRNWKKVVPFLKVNDGCYLDGWWQYSKLALSVRKPLIEELVPVKKIVNKEKLSYLQMIESSDSVSLHVRRGDYLSAKSLYGNICTDNYYVSAIREINRRISNPTFFIFSDDEEHCKSAFKSRNFIIIPFSKPEKAYEDMLLMSKCKHHIIANSSFSWWGTTLSNMDGINIMPLRHNNKEKENHLIIPGSISIDNKGNVLS